MPKRKSLSVWKITEKKTQHCRNTKLKKVELITLNRLKLQQSFRFKGQIGFLGGIG